MGPGPILTISASAPTDVETFGQTVTAITDLATEQVMMLIPGSNIAQVITPRRAAPGCGCRTERPKPRTHQARAGIAFGKGLFETWSLSQCACDAPVRTLTAHY